MHFGMGSITRCRDVTDAEYGYCSDLNTTRFLRRMIEAERPDLIAFTGKSTCVIDSLMLCESAREKFWCRFELNTCLLYLKSPNIVIRRYTSVETVAQNFGYILL